MRERPSNRLKISIAMLENTRKDELACFVLQFKDNRGQCAQHAGRLRLRGCDLDLKLNIDYERKEGLTSRFSIN